MSDTATTPSAGTGAAPSGAAPSSASNGNAHSGKNFARNFATGKISAPKETTTTPEAEVTAPFARKNKLDALPEVEEEAESAQVSGDEPEVEEISAEPSEEEEAEEDFSWVKDFKDLHGLDLKELLTALQQGQLPEALHDIIKIKLKNGDEEWESPLSKARKEAMLHQDYTRKTQAFNRERDEYNADKNEFVEMLQTWKSNPEAFLNGMERLEFPILDAAKMLAQRMRELDEMTPKERELYEAKQKYEKELAQMKQEQARAAKNQATKQQDNMVKAAVDTVSSVGHQLFARANIPVDQKTWTRFLHNFEIISSGVGPDRWTPEMVEHAFEATSADYQQALGKRSQQQAAAAPAAKKTQFESPAREQVAKLKSPAQPRKLQTQQRGSEFMKNLLGRAR